jgi:PAS domain S-box-containing protein
MQILHKNSLQIRMRAILPAWQRLAIFLIILSFLLFGFPSAAFAQQGIDSDGAPPSPIQGTVRFEHLTSEEGLSNDRVMSVMRDNQGFLWFGTQDGLNRYDGYDFRVFRHQPENDNSLSANFVLEIFEDHDGNIWLGTRGGLNRYDPKTERFTRYRHDPEDPESLSSDNVYAIFEDQDGNIWVGTTNGLDRLEPQIDGFVHNKHDPDDPTSLSHNAVRTIIEDTEGNMWIGTDGGGLNRFDRKKETFFAYRHNPGDPNTLGHDSIIKMLQDDEGVFWLATFGGGLDRLEIDHEDKANFTHYRNDPDDLSSLSENNLYAIDEDESGGLWIGTLGGGLNRFDRRTEQFKRFQHNPSDPYSLNHDTVLSLAADPTGLLWVGTAGGGVNVLDLEAKAFKHVYAIPGDPNSLNNNDVMGIYQDPDGVLWIGTGSGGLNKFDRQTNEVSFFQPDPNDPDSISGNMVREIAPDADGMLWLASWQGLNRFDPRTGEATVYLHDPDDPDSLLHNSIYTVRQVEDGSVLIGTSNGVNHLDPLTGEISTYHHNQEINNILSNTRPVLSIEEDGQGTLWIGTGGGGLIEFNPQEERITQYQHNPNDPGSLVDNTIWNIFLDHAGRLWIGTSIGLDRFDSETGEFIHYNEKDGFPPGGVASILEDDLPAESGGPNLWVSSSAGLTRFNPETGTIRNFDATAGLQGNAFNWSSAFKNENGELFFGGTNGLTSFFPAQIDDNTNVPPVVITNLELDNQPVEITEDGILSQAVAFTDQLVLPHDARVISFEFAALSYRAPEKNRYRYKLEGFDEGWTEVAADRRLITYTNLDPGDYTFRVLGSNNDGEWNEEGASIDITITPPWWGTTWFRGTAVILIVALVAGGFLWQRRVEKRRQENLETQVTDRTHELQEAQTQIQTLIDNAPVGISVSNLDGDFLLTNPRLAEITGYSETELKQINVISLYQDPAQRHDLLDQLETEQTVQDFGLQLKRKDGSIFLASVNLSLITRGDQDVILAMIEDVTKQVEAEETIREVQASEAKTKAVSEERERLARELHDSVTQALYSTSLMAEALPDIWESHREEALQSLEEIRQINRVALADMRTLLLELRPAAIAERPLGDLLRSLAEALSARADLPIVTSTVGECQMPSQVQAAFYRIAQEALNNTVKHARASQVWVNLTCAQDKVTMNIRDDGRGFDAQDRAPHQLGLDIMRERAQEINAELITTSQPDQGTQVQVIWNAS